MKTTSLASQRSHGYMLFEVLVYLGVVTAVLTVAYLALERSIRESVLLRRAAADVTRTLQAGERWRADIRAASQFGWEQQEGEQVLRLQTPQGTVAYRFSSNTVFRAAGGGVWSAILSSVRHSAMNQEARATVTAWRWEVELQPRAKAARTRPLFTFLAVPANGGAR
jgi:Tfp pilus assembly protein PilE